MAVLGRCLFGLLSGNLGVLKSFLSEITDGSNRGKGFSYLNVAWSVGSILGPLVGGFLCYPVEKYPYAFQHLGLMRTIFHERPFLLPCLVCVFGNVFTSICIAIAMIETVKKPTLQQIAYSQVSSEEDESQAADDDKNDVGNIELGPIFEQSSSTLYKQSPTTDELNGTDGACNKVTGSFFDGTVVLCISLYGLLAFGDIIGNETLPLFCKLDNNDGGLSLNTSEIGFALSIGGFAGLAFSLFVLPSMIDGGNKKVEIFRTYSFVNAFLILIFPFLGYLLQFFLASERNKSFDEKSSRQLIITLLIVAHTCRYMASILSFTVVVIFVNHSVIDAHLGKVNGFGQMAAAVARSVGPAFGGVLWSQSLKHHFIFCNFMLVSLIMMTCTYMSWKLPSSIENKKI